MWWGPWQPAGGMGLEHGPGPRRASLLEVLAPRFSRKGPWGEVSYHRTRGRGGVEGRTLSEAQSGSCSLSGCNNVLSWGGGGQTELSGMLGYLPRGAAPSGAILEHLSLHRTQSQEPRSQQFGPSVWTGSAVSAQGRAQKGSPFAGLRTQWISPSLTGGETEARQKKARAGRGLAGCVGSIVFTRGSPEDLRRQAFLRSQKN